MRRGSPQEPPTFEGDSEPLPESDIRGEAPEGVVGSGPSWRLREEGPSGEFLLAALFVLGVLVLAFLLATRRDRR